MNILKPKSYLLFLSLFLSIIHYSFAQNESESFCGTETSPESLEYYNSLKPQIKKLEQEFITKLSSKNNKSTAFIKNAIPVKAHVIRTSSGTGGLCNADINNAIANLNETFAGAYMEFFLCDGIDYINNDNFYRFKKDEESLLTETNNVSGLINIYFTNSIENTSKESICGYSNNMGRSDVIIMKNSCATNGSSLAHEMGHFFSLRHTHGSNNNELTSELVNGENCDTDGDGICDTPADPQLSSSNVDYTCAYIGTKTDVNGDTFSPDTANIMSYSKKGCRIHFSTQQLARMFAFYQTSKNYFACPSMNANFTVDASQTCEESLTVNFKNKCSSVTNWEWDVDGDNITDYKTQNPSHTYGKGIYNVTLTVSNNTKTISKTFFNTIKVGTLEAEDLFNESFENFDMLGDHGWTAIDSSENGYNWFLNTGNTKSDDTGPLFNNSKDNKPESYIYAEASGVKPGDVAEFVSPCFNINNENSELEFAYHMFGEHIGELHIDLKTEDGYINDVIPALYGNQQNNQSDAFLTKTIDLSAYTNQTIKVRFRAVRGIGWKGDIAIDDIFIKTIDIPISDEIKVYPNPVKNDIFYIKTNNPEKISSYEIINLVGQKFASGKVTNQPINVSKLASGTYLLILTNDDSRVVKKMIK